MKLRDGELHITEYWHYNNALTAYQIISDKVDCHELRDGELHVTEYWHYNNALTPYKIISDQVDCHELWRITRYWVLTLQ